MNNVIHSQAIIPLMLTVGQVEFIICGLKDCADQLEETKHEQRHPEDRRDYEVMIRQNRALAESLHQDMRAWLSEDVGYLVEMCDVVKEMTYRIEEA